MGQPVGACVSVPLASLHLLCSRRIRSGESVETSLSQPHLPLCWMGCVRVLSARADGDILVGWARSMPRPKPILLNSIRGRREGTFHGSIAGFFWATGMLHCLRFYCCSPSFRVDGSPGSLKVQAVGLGASRGKFSSLMHTTFFFYRRSISQGRLQPR